MDEAISLNINRSAVAAIYSAISLQRSRNLHGGLRICRISGQNYFASSATANDASGATICQQLTGCVNIYRRSGEGYFTAIRTGTAAGIDNAADGRAADGYQSFLACIEGYHASFVADGLCLNDALIINDVADNVDSAAYRHKDRAAIGYNFSAI